MRWLILCLLLVSGCGLDNCVVDEDCVKDSCCHSKSCVNVENKLDCEGVFCSMECQEGTLDCGGECKCVNGKCKGVFG